MLENESELFIPQSLLIPLEPGGIILVKRLDKGKNVR